jgi:hypothetical protein
MAGATESTLDGRIEGAAGWIGGAEVCTSLPLQICGLKRENDGKTEGGEEEGAAALGIWPGMSRGDPPPVRDFASLGRDREGIYKAAIIPHRNTQQNPTH